MSITNQQEFKIPITLSSNNSYKNQTAKFKVTNKNYRGMTLKEYFRLSEANPAYSIHDNLGIKETDQQNICSSQQACTPEFNNNVGRQKIKTQVYEDHSFCEQKLAFISKQKTNHKQILKDEGKSKFLKMKKNQIQLPTPFAPKKSNQEKHSKRVLTLPSHYQKQHLNRSTITSFYQLESKKKKMLDKVKHEKERLNQMKLSDAFFITKYAEKFKLNDKKKLKN